MKALCDLFVSLCEKGIPYKVILSKAEPGVPKKQKAFLRKLGDENVLVFEEEYDFGRVAQKNVKMTDIAKKTEEITKQYAQIDVYADNACASYMRSKKGKETLIGAGKLLSIAPSEALKPIDNKKEYFIPQDAEFLYHLGISDKDGRVHDKKQAKYRQINHFIDHLETVISTLGLKERITVLDLCCGKSYLSFAVYYYLTQNKKYDVDMLCVDQRQEVIDFCRDIAGKCGFIGMKFNCDDVRNVDKIHPNLVISLHACDIATDIVIDRAVALESDAILSTPCCHRYLNDRINQKELSFITNYPHLRGKLCEVITDSIRVARLKANGYSVTVTELTDPENTPKNTLIRAIKIKNFNKESDKAIKLRKEYESILSYVLGEKAEDYLKF